MSLQKLLPARLSFAADQTDPAALELVARFRASLDRLFAPLPPQSASATVRQLLALFAGDGLALLEAVVQRARERITPAFASPDEGTAARQALEHVRSWADATTQAWRTKLIMTDPALESLVTQRLERALDAGDAAVVALFNDTRAADEQTRLATAYVARSLLQHDARRLERMLDGRLTGATTAAVNAFVDQQRTVEERAAVAVLQEIDRSAGYVGSLAHLLGGYKPRDPLAAA